MALGCCYSAIRFETGHTIPIRGASTKVISSLSFVSSRLLGVSLNPGLIDQRRLSLLRSIAGDNLGEEAYPDKTSISDLVDCPPFVVL